MEIVDLWFIRKSLNFSFALFLYHFFPKLRKGSQGLVLSQIVRNGFFHIISVTTHPLESFYQQAFDGATTEKEVWIANATSDFIDDPFFFLWETSKDVLHDCECDDFEARGALKDDAVCNVVYEVMGDAYGQLRVSYFEKVVQLCLRTVGEAFILVKNGLLKFGEVKAVVLFGSHFIQLANENKAEEIFCSGDLIDSKIVFEFIGPYYSIEMITILLNIFLLLVVYPCVSTVCQQPQKAIYLSLNSLSNRDHLELLFLNVSNNTARYSLSYNSSTSLKSYELTDIKYQLAYNHHYQLEQYLDAKSIRVRLGIVNVLAQFAYQIKDSNQQVRFQGVAFARSYLDPASIEKELVQRDGLVEWQARVIEMLEFTALWVCEPIIGLPFEELHVIEKMLNNIVPVVDIRSQMQAQINLKYRILLKSYLNADQIFSTKTIPYNYRNIALPLVHQVRSISIDRASSGLVAFLSFGVVDADQQECGQLPQSYSQRDNGGVVQMFTLRSVKFIMLQSLRRGLFDIKLDKTWQSDVFQLFMGDFSNAVPYADTFSAIQPIEIQCFARNLTNTTISSFDQYTLYLEVPQQCSILLKNQTVMSIQMQLIVLARLTAEKDFLSVKVSKIYARKTIFKSTNPNFRLEREDVGEMIVQSLLNKTKQGLTFGSHLPLLSRKYPSIRLTPTYLIVFDASEFYPEGQTQSNTDQQKDQFFYS